MKSVKKFLFVASALTIFGLGVFGGVQEVEARTHYSLGIQNGGPIWDGNSDEPVLTPVDGWTCKLSLKRACNKG
jgi:hypothetical protein